MDDAGGRSTDGSSGGGGVDSGERSVTDESLTDDERLASDSSRDEERSDLAVDRDRVASDGGQDRSDPFTRLINPLIRERSWAVVLAFLLVTVLFVGGIGGGGQQQAGADQFAEDTEANDALEQMEEDFQASGRDEGGTSAQLFISDDRNVLSKVSLLRMVRFQETVEDEDGLRVESTTSPGSLVAEYLDPEATTPEDQIRVLERTSQRDLETAIAGADERLGLPVSTDFTHESARAEVAQIAITYDTPPAAGTDDYAELQYETVEMADDVEGWENGDNLVVFGDAILDEEILQLLSDTSIIVFPAALLLIVFFLIVAYRDPIDLGLGIVALVMTLIWTFGFMGYAGIPFSDSLITVFPLLLAVGIDFGIHIINRYREERALGAGISEAMGITTNQLTAAFLIVTITTVFGFAANLTSSLAQLRDFAIVASVGITFTFLIFGVFLPASKVGFDRLRDGTRFPQFGTNPLGNEGSIIGRILPVGARLARVAPAVVLVVALVGGAGAAAYGSGVDTEFNQEAFYPDQDRVDIYQQLPEPFAPADYTFMRVLDHLEEDFEMGLEGTVTVYVQDGDLREDDALRHLDELERNPPDSFVEDDRRADADSLISLIEQQREADPEFAATVDRYDTNGDGLPDRNVDEVYDALERSTDETGTYLTDDRSATRIDYQVDVDAEQAAAVADAQEVAEESELDATATGQIVVFETVINQITEDSVRSLIVAFVLTGAFLLVSYWWLEGRAVYGLINLVPVLVTVACLLGSMRYFDVPLSPINAPILAVSIGLGVDYTVHFMHRFVDEFEAGKGVHEALAVTARGTGGALTGSMLTTVCGLGVLYLALIPLIMEFGLLLALGVFYAYLASILVLPSAIVCWFALESRVRPAIDARRSGA